ncbi:hypothetical protein MNBD_ALPHA04-2201, partial [hydrothermal vent metagenome]
VHVRELDGLTELKADGQPYLSRPLSDPRFAVPDAGFYWQITRDGFLPVKSASLTRGGFNDDVAASGQVKHEIQTGPTGIAITYGLVRKTAQGDNIRFVIATDQRLLDAITDEFEAELKIWLAILAILLLANGGAIIMFGLRPLDKLGEAAGALRRGETDNIEGDYPQEIAPLVDNLNAYISSNQELVARARVQAGNLAHALRTPLAVMTDEAERMVEEDRSAREAKTFLEQSRLMTQQIEYQLVRARASADAKTILNPADFVSVAERVIAAIERLYPDKIFLLDNQIPAGTRLAIDPNDLSEILGCLFDNAGKWADSEIDCSVRIEGDEARISICDDGPGLMDVNLHKAFEVGTRFDPEVPGTGLGLAIARDLVQNAKGEIRLYNGSKHKIGLSASLSIPLVLD